MSERTPAVVVDSVTKSFKIPTESANGIKQKILNVVKGKKGYRLFTPLNKVSFTVEKGEFFGIVGRNGSGKSTLLKTIAGIYTPNGGSVSIRGTLVPFIELGVGFNPELTGRENVFLNGALLGFSNKEVDAMYDDIVSFAELDDFMDERLKNYSSGMQVRLAFSIAIQAHGDILLLDEVLAVGDEAFQRKCFEYFASLKKQKRTVILVTHDMGSVRRFCTRAMLIHNGVIEKIGSTKEVASLYEQLNMPKQQNSQERVSRSERENDAVKVKVSTVDGEGKKIKDITPKDKVKIILDITARQKMTDIYANISIHKVTGEQVYWATTNDNPRAHLDAGSTMTVSLDLENVFSEGEYYVNINVTNVTTRKDYIVLDEAAEFRIVGWGENGWILHPKAILQVGGKE